nr:50S ribosomal protein L3P, large subunit ribosomal protein L3 [uncultured archaeon]
MTGYMPNGQKSFGLFLRHGSLQYWPRKRAKRIVTRTRHWAPSKDAKPLGFAGWKAGMTHVQLVDQNSKSPTFGKTIVKPVTVLDAPSLFVAAIRFYKTSFNGDRAVGEKWSKLPKDIKLKLKTDIKSEMPKEFDNITLVVATQPAKSGMRQIKSDLFEIGIGGTSDQKLAYADSVLGKEINAKDIFKPGEFVDASAVTKAFGFTGPVKRFGIRIQTRKDKQMHRHVGSIGSTVPRHIDWRVPAAGQHGFHTRTDFTKKLIMIDDASKVTPSGGFVGYGLPKSVILIEGSVPGPRKRLVRIRKAARDSRTIPIDVKYISVESKQGK